MLEQQSDMLQCVATAEIHELEGGVIHTGTFLG